VVDFKTGSAKALKAGDVAQGSGLQSLLYAMAMRSLGAGTTNFSLLTRNAELKEQIDLDAALQSDAALSLARDHASRRDFRHASRRGQRVRVFAVVSARDALHRAPHPRGEVGAGARRVAG
jgi:hypothetical protein